MTPSLSNDLIPTTGRATRDDDADRRWKRKVRWVLGIVFFAALTAVLASALVRKYSRAAQASAPPTGTALVNSRGDVISWSREAELVTGVKSGDVADSCVFSLLPKRDRDGAAAMFARAVTKDAYVFPKVEFTSPGGHVVRLHFDANGCERGTYLARFCRK